MEKINSKILKNITITKKEIEILKKIKYIRRNQDTFCTNLPIYLIQTKENVPTSINLDELKNIMKQVAKEEEVEDMINIIKENNIECEGLKFSNNWITRAIFLSVKEAEEYMKSQQHNLNEPRLFVMNIGYSNEGLLSQLLQELDKK